MNGSGIECGAQVARSRSCNMKLWFQFFFSRLSDDCEAKKGICIMLISVNDVGIHKYLLSSLELVSCVFFSPFRAIERQRSIVN